MEIPANINSNAHSRLAIFRALLQPLPPGRLLDLATGHGSFAVAAHELGWQVTAVDVRTTRFPNVHGIEWVQADVRHYPFDAAAFQAITVLGILYHLKLPDQLALLRRCVGTPTIVDTHVSTTGTDEQAGYRGHYEDENVGGSDEWRRQSVTSAWDNRWSWWGTIESTERLLHAAGFHYTFRLSPLWSDVAGGAERPRTWWWCL
jgi:hypothetical protein